MALLLASLMQGAHADPEDMWNLNAGINTTHVSNLFFSPQAFESSDQILATTVGLKVNKPAGLQRFVLDASLTDNRFRTNDYLDFVGKNLTGAWLWSLTPRIKGNLSANYNEGLNSFIDYRGRERNLRTTQMYRFDVEGEIGGGFSAIGGVNHFDQKNSELFIAQRDYQTNAAEFGIKYLTSTESSVTLLGRRSRGEYTQDLGGLEESGFDQNEAELRVAWVATGKSTLVGRLAYINRVSDTYAMRDFSGPVGSLDWLWNVDAKLRINVGFRQDLVSYQDFEASYYKAQVFSIAPVWQVFSKTALRASYSRETRDYLGAPVAVLGGREDTLQQALVAVDWTPLRPLTVSTFVQRQTRTSDRAINDFDNDMAGISGSYAF
ncbi:MAG: putative exosortase B-associated extracellular polysaccharide biosynthesis transporter EpsL [Rhodoferax sp.]|nr:putative exosortase B-associated extracellular polysaccharide biosynthesis transporter EpsL [Rhodoferax sp.]